MNHAHYIRLRFCGPTNYRDARYVASWLGWPSDDSRPVRKSFHYDYGVGFSSAYEVAARAAAEAFVAWLNAGTGDMAPRHRAVRRITVAEAFGPDYAVLVETCDASDSEAEGAA